MFEVTVPACGHQVYGLTSDPVVAGAGGPGVAGMTGMTGVTATPTSLENQHLRIELDEQGHCPRSPTSRPGARYWPPVRWATASSYTPITPTSTTPGTSTGSPSTRRSTWMPSSRSRWSTTGPLRAGIRVVRRFAHSRITQVIGLDSGSRFVDFVTEVDWHETNRLLKVAFPVNVRSLRATYEIQFGHVERPTHTNTSWDVARFEVCAHKWADLSEPGYGVALLNDCKYGYDIAGNVIRLSLLRAPTWPDPEADRGGHHFTYRLLPHAGDLRQAGVIDAGYDLNVPLRAVATSPHPGSLAPVGSLLSVDAPNVVVEAVKRADDDPDALIVRLYEAWGQRGPVVVTGPWEISRAVRTDLLERELAEPRWWGAKVDVDLGPFEIATLRLERAEH